MSSPNSSRSNGLTLFPFILEDTAPSDEFESARVSDPVGIPKLLNLFPLTPVVESSTRQRYSPQSLGLETLQTFSRKSKTGAVTRRESTRLLSQSKHHDPTLPLFKCLDSGYVRRDESLAQMSLMRSTQQDLPMLTSCALSIGQSQPTHHGQVYPPSASSPVQDPHVKSSKGKGQMVEADGILSNFGPNYVALRSGKSIGQSYVTGHGQVSPPSANAPLQDPFPYVTPSNGKGADKGKSKMVEADGGLNSLGPNYLDLSGWKSMMLAPQNSDGPSGYASSSMAATPNNPSMAAANINQVPKKSRKQRKHSNAGGNLLARYGPQPRSSPFRGVTHYKRTDRWEAHIWHKGTQLYISASATAEQAARCYDRAAIHFRRMNAQLNYNWNDYVTELRQLVEVSDSKLMKILRKHSFGEGTLYPDYPPLKEH